MTFSTKDLRELLASTSPEVLAKEFTDALNGALEEIAVEEEKKAAEAAAKEAKLKDTQLLLDHFKKYIETHYPEFPIEMIRFDAEIFETAFDSTFGDTQFIKDVKTITEAAKTFGSSSVKSTDPLAAFLKSHGL